MAVSENQQSRRATELKDRKDKIHSLVDQVEEIMAHPATSDAEKQRCEHVLSQFVQQMDKLVDKENRKDAMKKDAEEEMNQSSSGGQESKPPEPPSQPSPSQGVGVGSNKPGGPGSPGSSSPK